MPRPPEDDPIADAGFLLRDDPPGRSPAPTPPAGPTHDPGGYDLEGDDPPEDDRQVAPPIPTARATKRPKVELDGAELPPAAPAGRVDQVWSRTAEWWPTLIAQAAVLLITAYLASATLAVNDLATPLVIVFLGVIAFLIVSYPIFITMERPVRMTPEQAAKDYFAALSHVRPHHRRMWLLLSSAGRETREFSTFPEFRAYWKQRVAAFKAGKVGNFAALHFKVTDFKAEKSVGKTAIDGKYTVVVSTDPDDANARIATFHLASGFVKGPDSQWYLDRGTLTDDAS